MNILKTYIVPHPPIIIPEIGRGKEQVTINTLNAYHTISKEIAELKPDTIIISSPHAQMYLDYFHISPGKDAVGNFRSFGAKSIKFSVKYDQELIDLITQKSEELDISAGTEGEVNSELDHGTMVPLYFISKYYTDFKVVRLSPSGLSPHDHYEFGKVIQSVIPKGKKVIWVASGDLSHKLKLDGPYGLAKEGPIFDKKLTEILSSGNFKQILNINSKLCREAAECGLNSFIMMAGFLDSIKVKSTLLSYEGPFGVGYAVATYQPLETDSSNSYYQEYELDYITYISKKREQEDEYLKLARMSLEYYTLNNHKLKKPKDLSDDLMTKKAGVFVSLHIHNHLRGCVGTIVPTKSCIAEEIINNAISAGFYDPRFTSIKKNELNKLEYKVDVLLSPEKIKDSSELDVKRYGVIVTKGRKSGLLLPNLEGVDTIEEQISIAKQKAGIREDENCELERFEVIRHE